MHQQLLSKRFSSRGRYKTTIVSMAALIAVFIALVIPNRISAISPMTFICLPLEILLLGLSLLMAGFSGWFIHMLSASLLGTGILVKMADMAAYQTFGRPFNPVLDARFPADGLHLLQGSIGQTAAYLVTGLLLIMLLGIFMLSYFLIGRSQYLLKRSPKISSNLLLVGLCLWAIGSFANGSMATKPFYDLVYSHVESIRSSSVDLKNFNNIVDTDPYANLTNEAIFAKLKGKDVLIVFIESYGRTVLDQADYAAHIRPILERGSADLAANGLIARSAYLTSPTYGGISWLAHGSLLSGLWINSQVRYDRLVMSKRPSLNKLFQRAGWRTVAVQPAHTMDWPQGAYFGYDKIYASQDLGYQGQPFNWITMPDQYTLSAIQHLERKPGMRQSVMAEIALISSHAPWTPLPQMVTWDQVGDGSIFNQARTGDTPEKVWQMTERIREQYRKSIEYALTNIMSYAITYGDENLVILVLGDHQPAPFVTEESNSHEVLVHLISRDAKVIEAIKDWRWSEGMLPAIDAPTLGMDKLRDRFIAAFSKPEASFTTLRK